MKIRSRSNIAAFVEGHLAELNRVGQQSASPPQVSAREGPNVYARIDHGRWIGDCPNPHCSGAELVDLDDLRFFCLYCFNEAWDGSWLFVFMPRNWPEIAASLEERPVHEQNWHEESRGLHRA